MGVVKIHRDFEIENITLRKSSQTKDKNISRINYLLEYGKYQSTLDVEDKDLTVQDDTQVQKTCLEHTKENDSSTHINDDLEAAKVFFHQHFFSMFVCFQRFGAWKPRNGAKRKKKNIHARTEKNVWGIKL